MSSVQPVKWLPLQARLACDNSCSLTVMWLQTSSVLEAARRDLEERSMAHVAAWPRCRGSAFALDSSRSSAISIATWCDLDNRAETTADVDMEAREYCRTRVR